MCVEKVVDEKGQRSFKQKKVYSFNCVYARKIVKIFLQSQTY